MCLCFFLHYINSEKRSDLSFFLIFFKKKYRHLYHLLPFTAAANDINAGIVFYSVYV